MKRSRPAQMLALAVVAAALTACGGGGGGGGGGDPDTTGDSGGDGTTEPVPGSGLDPATGTLNVTVGQAAALLSKVKEAYQLAPGGAASMALGRVAPHVGDATASAAEACASGGTVTYAPDGASAGVLTYADCTVNGVTYSGTAPVTFSRTGGTVDSYTIDQKAVTATVEGNALALDDKVRCTGSGASLQCVGFYKLNMWGDNFEYAGGVANGSYQCECSGDRWNTTLKDYSSTGGSAETQAGVGNAVITRHDASSVSVQINANGTSRTFELNG